jgi:arylformamidase
MLKSSIAVTCLVSLFFGSTVYTLSQSPATNPQELGLDSPPPVSARSTLKKSLDIPYASVKGVDPNLLSLDIYAPQNSRGLPVIVMIHGGGWRRGDKANASMVANKVPYFVNAGYVYVSINYRLSPAVKHPVHVQDVAKALVWIHDHIAQYGGNPNQISLMGHSAGAHLAALVATDDRYLKALGQDLTLLKGVILLDSAAYNLSRSNNESGEGDYMRDLYTQAFGSDPNAWKDASPMTHIAPGKHIPPFLIFYASPRRSKVSQELADALVKAGTSARVVQAEGKDHSAINADIGKVGDRPTQVIMQFLAGERAKEVPTSPLKSGTSRAVSVRNHSPFLNLTFHQDFFPGTRDRRGQLMAGTETNYIVAHKGKLWASVSYLPDRSGSPAPDYPGSMILTKPAFNKGLTGMAIIRALIAGERNPHSLAALKDRRIHSSTDEIVKALTGDYRGEHLFVLQP